MSQQRKRRLCFFTFVSPLPRMSGALADALCAAGLQPVRAVRVYGVPKAPLLYLYACIGMQSVPCVSSLQCYPCARSAPKPIAALAVDLLAAQVCGHDVNQEVWPEATQGVQPKTA